MSERSGGAVGSQGESSAAFTGLWRAVADPLVRGSVDLMSEDTRGVDPRSKEVCRRDLDERLAQEYGLSPEQIGEVIQLVRLDTALEATDPRKAGDEYSTH